MEDKKAIPNPEIKYTQLFINNEFVDSVTAKTFPAINPSTEETICQVQSGHKEDIDIAVKAARKAFQPGSEWRKMDPSKRGDLLNKLADLIERDATYLASLEAKNTGKLFKAGIGLVPMGAKCIRYYAGWADKIMGTTIPCDGHDDVFSYTVHEPLGVVGTIIPWNFPIVLFCHKVAPAVASGNCVIIKPAEQSPLTALYMAALCKEAGFPPGVIQVIPGYGETAGAALASHPDVNKITFTGSTEVGHLIMEACGKSNLKRPHLELGGKSPLIVFADADLDEAVKIAQDSVMQHSGQICIAPSRTFVHSDIYEEFVKKSVEKAKKRCVGHPLEENTDNGPQVSQEQVDKILDLIESGRREGAKLECGGDRIKQKGYFIQPTVFSNVSDDMRIAKEEIFGPVQSIFKFDDIDEVIARANNTQYGLASGVMTKDLNKAMKVARSLQAGKVWINTYMTGYPQAPIGGYKQSGMGYDFGKEGIDSYYQVKSVVMKLDK